jgi:hypothetical protein
MSSAAATAAASSEARSIDPDRRAKRRRHLDLAEPNGDQAAASIDSLDHARIEFLAHPPLSNAVLRDDYHEAVSPRDTLVEDL